MIITDFPGYDNGNDDDDKCFVIINDNSNDNKN